MMSRLKILNFTPGQLEQWISSSGGQGYRSNQILRWIYQRSAESFDEMTDLPAGLRAKLSSEAAIFSMEPVSRYISAGGDTRKVLFRLDDGRTIESSIMLYGRSGSSRERRTVCISTQVGCPVGCPFCATGQQGFERNLEAGEIIEQVLYFANMVRKDQSYSNRLRETERNPITNVVYMGMGEPLANYDAVWQSIMMLNSKKALGLGARQITLSTAGLVPQIRRLAGESIHVELAVSLHAANNRLRDRLVPVNRRYPLEMLIKACSEYLEKTGRRPTFEYALLDGINASPVHVRELAMLLGGLNCHVNVIAGNPTANRRFVTPDNEQAARFVRLLVESGVSATLRVSRGTDIEAGCGQLRSRWAGNKASPA